MEEIIKILNQKGFSFEDLLEAITDWTHQKPGLNKGK
jgi:hypothetical protein